MTVNKIIVILNEMKNIVLTISFDYAQDDRVQVQDDGSRTQDNRVWGEIAPSKNKRSDFSTSLEMTDYKIVVILNEMKPACGRQESSKITISFDYAQDDRSLAQYDNLDRHFDWSVAQWRNPSTFTPTFLIHKIFVVNIGQNDIYNAVFIFEAMIYDQITHQKDIFL